MEVTCTICRHYSERHIATPEHEANANIYAEGISAGEYKAQSELASLRAENAELREALQALITRASSIDKMLLEVTGSIADCEIGEITRARAILAKREWSADDILKREG